MAFAFFTIPVRTAMEAQASLNAFLQSHKVMFVDRRWVDQGADSFWAICVDYLEGGSGVGKQGSSSAKVDYKEVLKPEDFAVFARLREVRKEIAMAEAVPVYTIFTNEQLAAMVQAKATTRAALAKIDGIGDARVEKYGARMLAILAEAWKPSDEKDR